MITFIKRHRSQAAKYKSISHSDIDSYYTPLVVIDLTQMIWVSLYMQYENNCDLVHQGLPSI